MADIIKIEKQSCNHKLIFAKDRYFFDWETGKRFVAGEDNLLTIVRCLKCGKRSLFK